jgi:hypothetical protein
MDNLDPQLDNIEIIDDEIAFGTGADVAETVIDVPAIELTDSASVLDVAAPVAVATVAPLAAAIVREEVHTEVVEESIPAPIAVVQEPVAAPIVEPVHHVRWPWALLALPLLAIPFLARGNTPEVTVAEPVVVQTPVVREVAPAPKVVAPAVVAAPKVTPVPVCDGDFIAKDAAVIRTAATATATEVAPVAANTVLRVDAVEDGYYEVTVGSDHGYLPESVVVCQVALAPATVTG